MLITGLLSQIEWVTKEQKNISDVLFLLVKIFWKSRVPLVHLAPRALDTLATPLGLPGTNEGNQCFEASVN